ncbi:hypothetical protein C8R44DRAFT_753463 [Mycena epipterygia]|nr:hypothetical protein C8R44DRAFT_753463 [Mycena epipterygia]
MSDYCAIFITDPRSSPKAVNRALLLMQDFDSQYSGYPNSYWTILTSKNLPSTPPKATVLPLPESFSNEFASMSLADIYAFIREHKVTLQALDLSYVNWVVIDRKGLETSTCLVCQRFSSDPDEEVVWGEDLEEAFFACRVPYEGAYTMFANLDIGHRGFMDFVDTDAGTQEDGTWKYGSSTGSRDNSVQLRTLKELRDGGHAD